jgi:hypothetical protein
LSNDINDIIRFPFSTPSISQRRLFRQLSSTPRKKVTFTGRIKQLRRSGDKGEIYLGGGSTPFSALDLDPSAMLGDDAS